MLKVPNVPDLHQVQLELRSYGARVESALLTKRLLCPDRLRRHLRLELRTVVLSRRCHPILLVNDSAELLPY